MKSPWKWFERCIAWVFKGWYFFLKDEDSRFSWLPRDSWYQTTAGARNTPLRRREDSWTQYVTFTINSAHAWVVCYPTAKWWKDIDEIWRDPRMWVSTQRLASGSRVSLGVGIDPMYVLLIAEHGTVPIVEKWQEVRVNRSGTTDIWECLNPASLRWETLENPPNLGDHL